MEVSDLLSIVATGLGIIVLGVGALLFVNGSYNKARTIALREDNQDLRARVDDQDKVILRHIAKESSYEARLTAVESENQLLRDMVTQRADVQMVLETLNNHHATAMTAWKEIKEAIETHE